MRSSVHFKGEDIFALGNYHNSPFLIVTDRNGNVSQLNLSTGILMDSTNVEQYLPNKNNLAMSVLLNTETSYFIYNSANSQMFFASVTPNNVYDQIILQCLNLHFYNNTLY